MVEWSIDALRACDSVRSIVVAARPATSTTSAAIDLGVVDGGATRAQSVANAPGRRSAPSWSRSTTRRGRSSPRSCVEAPRRRPRAHPEAAGVIAAAPVTDTIKRRRRRRSRRCICPVQRWITHSRHRARRSIAHGSGRRRRRRCSASRRCARRWRSTPERRDAATDEAMLVEAAGGTVLIHPCRAGEPQGDDAARPARRRAAARAERAAGLTGPRAQSVSRTQTSAAAKQSWPTPRATPRLTAPEQRRRSRSRRRRRAAGSAAGGAIRAGV